MTLDTNIMTDARKWALAICDLEALLKAHKEWMTSTQKEHDRLNRHIIEQKQRRDAWLLWEQQLKEGTQK